MNHITTEQWIDGAELEPGPWYSLAPSQQVTRWLRYQPIHKMRSFGWWLASTAKWFARYRWLPKRDADSEWCNRIVGDSDAVCPMCMWQFTVASDAQQLERWHRIVFPS